MFVSLWNCHANKQVEGLHVVPVSMSKWQILHCNCHAIKLVRSPSDYPTSILSPPAQLTLYYTCTGVPVNT